jgi:hypothetical protein
VLSTRSATSSPVSRTGSLVATIRDNSIVGTCYDSVNWLFVEGLQ